jgi:CheY-like chemotaxis protein
VIVAEDDPDVRQLVTVAFRGLGYDVVEARTRSELLDELLHDDPGGKPDVIISDIRMPGLTGMEVLAGLRQADWPTVIVLLAVASSADAAIRAALREAPDVILLDVMMPGEGGLSLLRRLKDCDKTADIPVVLMTAGDGAALPGDLHARRSDPPGEAGAIGVEPREAGAAGVIWKPFEPSALPDEIVRIVHGVEAP